MTPNWIAGIDVGGTFTDVTAIDAASGEVRLAKVPTTPENQAFGVIAALEEARLRLADVAMIVHGTTIMPPVITVKTSGLASRRRAVIAAARRV